MKFVKVIMHEDVTGVTLYYINVDKYSKISYNYSELTNILTLNFDKEVFKGICEDFDLIHFEIFLGNREPDYNIYEVEIINYSLYVHEPVKNGKT